MPVDGDAANAASVQQDFKALADFEAWLMNPRAQSAAYAEAIRRYKDARLRDRFVIGHQGMPGGEFFQWREWWGNRTPWQFLAGASGTVLSPVTGVKWALNQTGGASNITIQPPGISAGLNFADTHPALLFDVDDAAANTSEHILDEGDNQHTGIWSVNMMIELDYSLQPHVVTDVTWVHGVCGSGEHINTIANGAFFIRANTPGTNWHARTIAGGIQTDVDTGVAGTADATHHFKIVMVGSAIDDGSANRVSFQIDGVEKANITTHIPASGTHVLPIWGGFTGGAASGNQRMIVGPPHWSQIIRSSTP